MASARISGTNPSRWNNPGGAGAWEAGVNTFGSSGYDYSAFSGWETDSDVDLVTAQVSPVLEMMDNRSSNTIWGGATSSSSYFRTMRATSGSRHNGNPGAGVLLSISNAGSYYLIAASTETYCQFYDIKVNTTCNSTSAAFTVAFPSTGSRLVGVMATCTNAGTGTATGFYNIQNVACYMINCVAYNCDEDGFVNRGTSNVVYNCTSVGNGQYGFNYTSNACVWKNNIAQSNTGGDYNGNGAAGTTHNLASDTTAPETGTYWDSKTITFIDAANDDYRITDDADAIGLGTDLSATFDDDIAYAVRS